MNQFRKTFSLGIFILSFFSWSGESQCPANVTPIRYRPLGKSQFSIPVTIDHKGPWEFLVDTGSQMTIIEPSLAQDLQLEHAGAAQLISGFRSVPAVLVSPDLIEAGSNAAHLASILVRSLAGFQSLHPELRGILGEDFLAGFDLLIDRKKKVLCLDPTTAMQRAIRGQRIPVTHQPTKMADSDATRSILVPTHFPDETARTLKLKLDSGADAPILYFGRLGHESYEDRLKTQRGTVVSGSTMYFRNTAPQAIQIGSHVVCGVRFESFVPFSRNLPSLEEDGLLPTSLFNRVFISYRGGFIVLEPR